jgi:hypothetical protein
MIAALAIGLKVSLVYAEYTHTLYALTIGTAVICLYLSQEEENRRYNGMKSESDLQKHVCFVYL